MIELPRTLATWAPQLELFPADVARALGHWLPRIDSAVGPLRSAQVPDGDPDGFDGIGRRGTYERLLASEWLFADAAPDEFIRRAASGEHGFLRLGYQSPASAARSVALFDAGWQQLGAPRLAHLALLVALARRAHAAQVPFFWGVVQAAASLHHGLSRPGIRAFLEARIAGSATAAQLERWWRETQPASDDDVWLIGGDEIGALARSRGVAHVEVREEPQPGPRQLHLEVRGPRQHVRRAVLELPAVPAAVRVLRHPFEVAAEPPRSSRSPRFTECSELIIIPGPRRLIGRVRGGLVAAHIPNSPTDKPGRSRWFVGTEDEPIVGVSYARKNLVVATMRGDSLAVYARGRGDGPPTSLFRSADSEQPFCAGESPRPLGPLNVETQSGAISSFTLIDGEHNLFALPWPTRGGVERCERLREGVVAMSETDVGCVLVCGEDALHVSRWTGDRDSTQQTRQVRFPRVGWRGRAHFGWNGDYSFVVALDYGDHWTVATTGCEVSVPTPTGQVLGAISNLVGPGLIVLDPGGLVIRQVGPDDTRIIAQLERPARHATMAGSLIGWIDDDELPHAWCIAQGRALLSPSSEGRS